MAANRTILILEGLPTAHLKAYVPNFPKHPWESRKSLKLRELCPSKVRWSRFVSLKNAVFSALFWRKSFFWPTSTKATTQMIGIFGKLCISAFCTYPNIRVFLNRQAVRILLTLPDWLDHISSQCVLSQLNWWFNSTGQIIVWGTNATNNFELIDKPIPHMRSIPNMVYKSYWAYCQYASFSITLKRIGWNCQKKFLDLLFYCSRHRKSLNF